MKTFTAFLCLTLLFSSCDDDISHEIKTDTQTTAQRKNLNSDKESVFLMYKNIRKITDKYSLRGAWSYAIKRKRKWKTDPSFDETFSIDISTEPQIYIIISLNGTRLTNNITSYLNKGDTLIFNVSNIHYENQTLLFYPVDSINKIVKWSVIEEGKIQGLGYFIGQ